MSDLTPAEFAKALREDARFYRSNAAAMHKQAESDLAEAVRLEAQAAEIERNLAGSSA